jgi:hypothetical protein
MYHHRAMTIILMIADLLVLLFVVIAVSRTVWREEQLHSLLLSICVFLALLAFGLASFAAASGLAGRSPFGQLALSIGLVVTAIVVRASSAPVQ